VETPTEVTARGATPHPEGAGRKEQRIVVGVDGSAGARLALEWALTAAARRGAALEVVSLFPAEVYWLDPGFLDSQSVEAIRSDTETRARGLVEEVLRDPDVSAVDGISQVRVGVVTIPGPVAPSLVHRAEGADLLVVGSRGRGGVRSTLLGSVALHCSAHAGCPVVVVHPAREESSPVPSDRPRVVVGLDDTSHAKAALVTAVAEAARLGARIDAVLAYEAPNYWSDMYAVTAPPLGESRTQARQRGEAIVASVLGPGQIEPDAVRVLAMEGPAGFALVRHAAGAELLVVGSRSRSTLPGMVLGSVALHCVVHAPCPVMVVRPVPQGTGPGRTVAAASARA
jgi:nucleotide-binding universal stress UspA family protein